MAGGRLEADPVFLGLTRPAMILGVTYAWFTLNGFFWALYFINTSDFFYLIFGAIGVHLVGFFITSKEPRFMDIVVTKASKCMKCRNTMFHGNTQSYDLY